MAEFKLLKYKYTWKGAWQGSTVYKRDDVVNYAGSSYVCLIGHTASADFNVDLSASRWVLMTQGVRYRGDWQPSTSYNQYETVKYKAKLYQVVTSHTSTSDFNSDLSNWELFLAASNWTSAWSTDVEYSVGDIINYGGIVYRCILDHTSASTNDAGLETDIDKWEIYVLGIDFKGSWNTGVKYKINDIVIYGGSIWQCKEGHTSGSDSTINFDAEEHWNLLIPGFKFRGPWQSTSTYASGDIVRSGGYIYVSLTTNYNSSPNQSIYQIENRVDPLDWEILSKGYNYQGQWQTNSSYKTGDLVTRGGNLYVAILDSTSDGSTLDYTDDSNWDLLVTGNNFRRNWIVDTSYEINDVIQYNGSTYIANISHISSTQNYPGDNGSGFEYWDILIEALTETGLNNFGDLVTYDLSRTLANDGSTLGLSPISKGSTGELLQVASDLTVEYQSWGEVTRNLYVDPNGIDSTNDILRGKTPFLPYRTIRFAAIHADDGFEGFTTINVEAGVYEEILPIIVPARTVILGAELRSTTIKPNQAVTALANDSTYTNAALTRISVLLHNVINQVSLTIPKTNTNSLDPVILGLTVSEEAILEIQTLLSQIQQYISYVIDETGSAVTITGSNTAVTTESYTNTVLVLEANKEFFAAEAAAFIANEFPNYIFDSERFSRDIRSFIDSIKYDIIYTGNYKSILAARWYTNAVQGSENDDMFYVRDSSGIRNCTLTGLAGTLNPPLVFELFQRPTGKSFISLDPGWGPNDQRVWITSRSPYIQNVTNIGTGCIGQKIDGSLHNGGNKSIVSNDFTQVLSDGIGAWVLNDGRAELVSVFTYYCQVGYLSEEGGTIRSLNGNCSYGTFGALADGIDPTEVPRIGQINNRTTEASVINVLIGENVDEINAFEFDNAGQFYTQAICTILGAGAGAECIFDDIRDNAVFDVFIRDISPNPAIQATGGTGYTARQGNAQVDYVPGTSGTSITIQSNDDGNEDDYLGKRVFIVSGAGAGQYGYITSYDAVNKVASISRESDNQPGWDHIISGRENSVFNGTTVYRIEPRVTFSDPGFSSESINVGVSTDWASAIYGETTLNFSNVNSEIGTGSVVSDDGLAPIIASFDVVKEGTSYVLEINNAGAGYAVGDQLTISGNQLGGTTPRNDVTINVTEISDDSTNSITAFTSEGIGASGAFVILTNGGTAGVRSFDGDNWTNFSMPTSGDWGALASGNNRFVAISKNSNNAAYSLDGSTWSSAAMPSSNAWSGLAYGSGIFLAISEDGNAGAISENGITWTSITMPTFGDSASNEWIDVTYGKNLFVMIAKSNNVSAHGTYDSGTGDINWTISVLDVIEDSSLKDWVSITYGKDKFIAISDTGDLAYSFDAVTWYGDSMPPQDDSTPYAWKKIRYSQGLFFAVGDTGTRNVNGDPTLGPTNFAATSESGNIWTSRTLSQEGNWKTVAFGNPYIDDEDSSIGNKTGIWIAVANNLPQITKIRTGSRAKARVDISSGNIVRFKIFDPGSGYIEDPTITVTDPDSTVAASTIARIADGVLSQPAFIARGAGYRSSNTDVTIVGDGFADRIPVGKFIIVDGLTRSPKIGTQLVITGNSNIYAVVTVEELDGSTDNNKIVQMRITPEAKARDVIDHGVNIELRTNFSNIRITGHDFLDIGTGNFIETNYPALYQGLFEYGPENEVREDNGGRVFYTSTDQSGNFRAGELFSVEQATGIVTISSDFFDLGGLTELRLGGVRLGGTGATVREFSTDSSFVEDSNNVVPTQRAIIRYLENRLTVGGSELSTSSFIAGLVSVGPTSISQTVDGAIEFPDQVSFNEGISGHWLAQEYFFKSFGLNDL